MKRSDRLASTMARQNTSASADTYGLLIASRTRQVYAQSHMTTGWNSGSPRENTPKIPIDGTHGCGQYLVQLRAALNLVLRRDAQL